VLVTSRDVQNRATARNHEPSNIRFSLEESVESNRDEQRYARRESISLVAVTNYEVRPNSTQVSQVDIPYTMSSINAS
jgi:hypothetical protein